jgi:hypothetical protein
MVQLPRTMHNTGNPRRWDTAALARRRQPWPARARAALTGHRICAAQAVMVNSSWTAEHIRRLWWRLEPPARVFPPCDVADLAGLPLDRKLKRLYLVSLAQFRPEKDHALQLRAFARARRRAASGSGHAADAARCPPRRSRGSRPSRRLVCCLLGVVCGRRLLFPPRQRCRWCSSRPKSLPEGPRLRSRQCPPVRGARARSRVGCLRQRSRGRPKPPLHGRGGSAGRAAPRAAGAPAAQVLAARLALIGGCRNAADAARVADLRALAEQLGLAGAVDFAVNAPFSEARRPRALHRRRPSARRAARAGRAPRAAHARPGRGARHARAWARSPAAQATRTGR